MDPESSAPKKNPLWQEPAPPEPLASEATTVLRTPRGTNAPAPTSVVLAESSAPQPFKRNSLFVPLDIGVTPFFEALEQRISAHAALHHPLLERFRHQPLSRDMLIRFASQQYLYSRLFARNLAAVISNVPDERARCYLIQNMYEEIGEPGRIQHRLHLHLLEAGLVTALDIASAMEELVARDSDGDVVDVLLERGIILRAQVDGLREHHQRRAGETTHPALFRRFLKALSLDSVRIATVRPLPETTQFIEEVESLCRHAPWLEALGAIGPGTESVVPTLYRSILRGIEQCGLVPKSDYVFWTIHVECDDGHGRNIVEALRPFAERSDQQELISRGAMRVLEARKRWFDRMEHHVFADDAGVP